MGAGASLYSLPDPYDFDVLLPVLADPEGTWAKLGNPEGLAKDEWSAAAETEGVDVARFFEGQLDRMYAWADRDRDGVISKADFLWFCAKANRAAQIPRVDLDYIMTNGLASYLGPVEATHGFRKALSAIQRRPRCAQVERPGSDGWLPLHTILTLRNPAEVKGEAKDAAKAARVAALPVIEALCRAYPKGASNRVMSGLNYLWPWGHTALDLAIMHHWGPEAIKLVIAAWPAGATTFDPDTPARVKKMKKPNPSWARYPRKTAEGLQLPETVMELLPHPSKKKKAFVWHLQGGENDGVEVDPDTMQPIVVPEKGARP